MLIRRKSESEAGQGVVDNSLNSSGQTTPINLSRRGSSNKDVGSKDNIAFTSIEQLKIRQIEISRKELTIENNATEQPEKSSDSSDRLQRSISFNKTRTMQDNDPVKMVSFNL